MSPAPVLLEVLDLQKRFGGVHAVQGVHFTLAAGEILALIGPNGAGKSTCFNMLNGQLRPDGGTIRFRGEDVTGLPPRAMCRRGAGRTFQITSVFASMSVCENIQTAISAHRREDWRLFGNAGARHRRQALSLLEQTGLAAQAERPCAELAYGDLKRLELGIALAGDPSLLLWTNRRPAWRRRSGSHSCGSPWPWPAKRASVSSSTEPRYGYRVRTCGPRSRAESRRDRRARRSRERAPRSPGALDLSRRGIDLCQTKWRRGGMTLLVSNLRGWYGAAQVLFGISLAVAPGEAVALLGRNGAGKSTTFKAIIGLLRAGTATSSSVAKACRASRPIRSRAVVSPMCRKTGASSPI